MLTSFLIYLLAVYVSKDPCAVVGILAPFRTAGVYLRIGHYIAAVAAFQAWLILEKLNNLATAGAPCLKNIFRFPESLVLPGTF
jgi:hypothetical protein